MIKLIILDIDGVMTDGKKFYTQNGDILCKQYNDKDFTAIKKFKALGITICFLSGDSWNKTMADNRNIKFYSGRNIKGEIKKIQTLEKILLDYNIKKQNTIYVGDDIFDIEVLKIVKEGFCPKDSISEVKNISTVIDKNGGNGVVAELFDILLKRGEINNPSLELVKNLDKNESSSKKMNNF